jgi:hypothetical protein
MGVGTWARVSRIGLPRARRGITRVTATALQAGCGSVCLGSDRRGTTSASGTPSIKSLMRSTDVTDRRVFPYINRTALLGPVCGSVRDGPSRPDHTRATGQPAKKMPRITGQEGRANSGSRAGNNRPARPNAGRQAPSWEQLTACRTGWADHHPIRMKREPERGDEGVRGQPYVLAPALCAREECGPNRHDHPPDLQFFQPPLRKRSEFVLNRRNATKCVSLYQHCSPGPRASTCVNGSLKRREADSGEERGRDARLNSQREHPP